MLRINFLERAALVLIAVLLAVGANSGRAQIFQLISANTTWRYNQQNLELGTAWREIGYDDTVAGWQGPSNILFGFETTPANYSAPAAPIPPQTFKTMFVNPLAQNPFVTNYYFRTHFTVPGPPTNFLSYASLLTTNYIDDGCIYYLNGVEILRYNMPTGAVNAASWSLVPLTEGYSPTVNETIFIRTNGITNLIFNGDNVLAVELHNAANTSGDEVFGMTLALFVPEPIVITNQPIGQTNLVGFTNVLTVGVTGSNPYYQWYSNNVKIAGATLATYTVPSAPSNAGVDYYVIITNVLGSATSALARVTILTDDVPIHLLQALSGPAVLFSSASNQCILTFDKTVLKPGATNPANYSVSILGTTTVLAITNAQAVGRQVRISADSNFIYGTNYVVTVYNVTGTNGIPIQPNPSEIGLGIIRSNPPPNYTNLMQMSQSWDWNESGTDLGSTWTSPDYIEDSDWGTGNGIFYFDTAGFKTACSGGPGTTISTGPTIYYFRTQLILPPTLLSPGFLRFTHYVEGGAAFYLNGTELFRFNLPTVQPLPYDAQPAQPVSPHCLTNLIFMSSLLPGTNTLAVELHEAANAPNAYFGLQLDYSTNFTTFSTNISTLPPSVGILAQPSGGQLIAWPTETGGVHWGLEFNTNLMSTGWTALPDTSPYTDDSGSRRRFFRLRAR